MSNVWLALALVGTFLTIFLLGVIVDMLMRERRRPVALLESQIGQVTDSVDLRQQELEGNAFDRAVMPTARRIGRTCGLYWRVSTCLPTRSERSCSRRFVIRPPLLVTTRVTNASSSSPPQ